MDEIASPIWSEFKLVGLDEMVDPELNKIDAKFGKDVEEVGKMGPPRMPKVPEGIDLEGLGIKLEGLAV